MVAENEVSDPRERVLIGYGNVINVPIIYTDSPTSSLLLYQHHFACVRGVRRFYDSSCFHHLELFLQNSLLGRGERARTCHNRSIRRGSDTMAHNRSAASSLPPPEPIVSAQELLESRLCFVGGIRILELDYLFFPVVDQLISSHGVHAQKFSVDVFWELGDVIVMPFFAERVLASGSGVGLWGYGVGEHIREGRNGPIGDLALVRRICERRSGEIRNVPWP
ncbi:MAG: hypothetical protein KVP17_004352 [Porospora cf. gigantea B]|uniref:uncharacterized protein n=1 Tax=Porospora cf. gigantea B TaxID=2853592 RepID=UPI0035719424|nr:MAG: hypothetical protein KVP17_004352 [Porospora cf. gigantea B]